MQKDGKLGPTGGPKHGAKTWEELMNQPIGGVDPWADEQTDEGAGAAGGDGAVQGPTALESGFSQQEIDQAKTEGYEWDSNTRQFVKGS